VSRRVAVLSGGRSSEHEVSLASARSVVDALAARGHEVVEIEIGRDGRWSLGAARAAELGTAPAGEASLAARGGLPQESVAAALHEVVVVFPVLHGPFGEDGSVQGLLELADVPYVGPGVTASALCMDKDLFKAVLRDRGIPVPRNVTLRAGEPARSPFAFPVFVKPARLGSSVGISKAHDERELDDAVALAFRHDEKVLVEEFVDGTEVEVGVLGNRRPQASLPGEIVVTGREWYDYEAKYAEGEMELVVPARVAGEALERAQELAVEAFVAAECEGMARVDLFVRDDGKVLVNELNTIPGFTATSVYAKLFEASGIQYADLLDRLIELALERHERRRSLRY
jgi:D-alanine-D-alanine ligase